MRIRTGNRRARRAFWRRKGHTHMRFNRGIWLRMTPEDAAMGVQCTHTYAEQPNWYRRYP